MSEVINRSRLNSSNSQGTTSDKYGPLSFSYNKKKSPSPASARRIPPVSPLASGIVRFGDDADAEDDGNASDDTSSSLEEVESDHNEKVEGNVMVVTNPNPFQLRRKRYSMKIGILRIQ